VKANRVCLFLCGGVAISLLIVGGVRTLSDHIASAPATLTSLTLTSGALMLGGVAWGAAFRESLHSAGSDAPTTPSNDPPADQVKRPLR
jgi:hypothetical protein